MNIKKFGKLLENDEIKRNKIIDIRDNYETKKMKIKGSTNIPMSKLLKNPSKYLEKNEKYYIICQDGNNSLYTTITLKFKRYKVKDVRGGYNEYSKLNIH